MLMVTYKRASGKLINLMVAYTKGIGIMAKSKVKVRKPCLMVIFSKVTSWRVKKTALGYYSMQMALFTMVNSSKVNIKVSDY